MKFSRENNDYLNVTVTRDTHWGHMIPNFQVTGTLSHLVQIQFWNLSVL